MRDRDSGPAMPSVQGRKPRKKEAHVSKRTRPRSHFSVNVCLSRNDTGLCEHILIPSPFIGKQRPRQVHPSAGSSGQVEAVTTSSHPSTMQIGARCFRSESIHGSQPLPGEPGSSLGLWNVIPTCPSHRHVTKSRHWFAPIGGGTRVRVRDPGFEGSLGAGQGKRG